MATIIPARCGAHLTIRPSQRIKIMNPSGHQVVDLWAFPIGETPRWMSMAQTRSKLMKLSLSVDDNLVDTHRDPVLNLVEDSSSGVHDMLFPPCDQWRYNDLGSPDHASCGGNLRKELADYVSRLDKKQGTSESMIELESSIRRWGWTPEAFNLFMNVPWSGSRGKLLVKRPACKENDFVVLEAVVESLIIMSACPNDVLNTNGGSPEQIAYELTR